MAGVSEIDDSEILSLRGGTCRNPCDCRLRPQYAEPGTAHRAGFKAVHALTDFESNGEKCMAEAGPLPEELGKHIGVHLPASTARTDTKENVHV